ncbi:MAG: hypothetical protein K0R73_225 [Candidatus Midichloriaceae bacterium]|jgi:ankyrin repeat protein|nr:hypothetical protein [Candidatus Midichloriaceae bacterium]
MNENIFTYIRNNKLRKVSKLLEKGQDPNAVNKLGESVICYAAKWGRLNIVKSLIKHDANIDPKALETAIKFGRKEIVELLLQSGASPNVDHTILEKANYDIVKTIYSAQKKQTESNTINNVDECSSELVESQHIPPFIEKISD